MSLTTAQRDRLGRCACGHRDDQHNAYGCIANVGNHEPADDCKAPSWFVLEQSVIDLLAAETARADKAESALDAETERAEDAEDQWARWQARAERAQRAEEDVWVRWLSALAKGWDRWSCPERDANCMCKPTFTACADEIRAAIGVGKDA